MVRHFLVLFCVSLSVYCQTQIGNDVQKTVKVSHRDGNVAKNFPKVQISNGILIGRTMRSGSGKLVNSFLGIPYAQPPTKNLRFKAPVPYAATFPPEGFEATKLPNDCPQWLVNPNTPISEDCLYLNVWVPANESTEKRNVFVWIYGGGFHGGSSSLDIYNGATLAAEADSIFVSMQYRLGPFGFLYLGTDDAPGNQGLLDQNLALRWVNSNIGAFGGYPGKVTLIGQSAGAASVSFHLLSPLSQGLFKRAVMMSGAATAPWAFNPPSTAKKSSLIIAKKAGCLKSDTTGFDLMKCLRTIDEDSITKILIPFEYGLYFPMAPTVDLHFLPDTPLNLLKTVKHGTDILVGNTLDEGSNFLHSLYPKIFSRFDSSMVVTNEILDALLQNLFIHLSEAQRQAISFEYKNYEEDRTDSKNKKLMSDAVGDAYFVCPCQEFVKMWNEQTGSNVFYYYFTHHTKSNHSAQWMGVQHGEDLPYFFGHPLNTSSEFTEAERSLSKRVIQLLANFAKTGVPALEWVAYSAREEAYELNTDFIGTKSPGSLLRKFRPRECAFWNNLIPKLKYYTENECEKTVNRLSKIIEEIAIFARQLEVIE